MSDERAEDEGDDDPKLKSMRAVWLQMRDEDPPQGGLAELLAAARTKADAMARPSWWKRSVALLRRPPVFALATVMIVLGGALLIGRRVEPSQGPAPKLDAQGSSEVTLGRATSTENVPEAPAPPPPPRETVPRDQPHHIAPASPPPPEEARNETIELSGGAAPTKPSGDVAPGMATSDEAARVKSSAEAVPHDDRGVDQLERQCETAAKKGDCAAVRTMVPRIEKTDRSYRKRITKDSPVAKCLE